MKPLVFFSFAASLFTLAIFFIGLSVFSQEPIPPPVTPEKYFLAILKNNINSAFITAVILLLVWSTVKKIFKNPVFRSSFSVSMGIAIISCAALISAYIAAVVPGVLFFAAIILLFAIIKLGEFNRMFAETNKLPRLALYIPVFELIIILSIMAFSYMIPILKWNN